MSNWVSWLCVSAWGAPREAVDFAELAASLSTSNAITVDTSTNPPSLTESGGGTWYGVVDGPDAVFTFGQVDITTLTASGSRPFVLLSRGDLTVRGSVSASANAGTPGPGGFAGRATTGGTGSGPGGGGGGANGGGGGAHGGDGGDDGTGALGGAAYGDLSNGVLSGGSGGGRSTDSGGNGGAGGGAIELGATGALRLEVGALVAANGTGGSGASTDGGGGGGGGGVLLHGRAGSACVAGATVRVRGGAGGAGTDDGGGGGGGGRIVFYGVPTTNCSNQYAGGLGGVGAADLDGYQGGNGVLTVTDPDGDADGYPYSADCDDRTPTRSPGAPELSGDGVDQDCDGAEVCFADSDLDGARDLLTTVPSADVDCADPGEAAASALADCDDGDASIHPLAAEVRGDGVDQDCDGREDCFGDVDGDGARNASTAFSLDLDCDDPGEALAGPIDCADGDASRYPGAPEVVGDGVDQSCDGGETCFVDNDDDDSRGTATVASADVDCADPYEAPAGASSDCDDTDPLVKPGAPEVVGDQRDQNCDGVETCYADADLDGWRGLGSVPSTDLDCVDPGEATDLAGVDCDEVRPAVNPGAAEVPCNALDDDCAPATLDERDLDGDSYSECTDCNDGVRGIYPGAAEVCDEIDQDCDLLVDEGLPTTTWYVDVDGDGFGDDGNLVEVCGEQPFGTRNLGGDCNDDLPTVNPAAPEVACNGDDDDCDLATPDGEDADGDGWTTCLDEDCDDTDPDVNPGADEVCDDVDDDCDPETPTCPDSGGTGGPVETGRHTGRVTETGAPPAHSAVESRPTDASLRPVDPGCSCSASGGAGGWVLAGLAALSRRRRAGSSSSPSVTGAVRSTGTAADRLSAATSPSVTSEA